MNEACFPRVLFDVFVTLIREEKLRKLILLYNFIFIKKIFSILV